MMRFRLRMSLDGRSMRCFLVTGVEFRCVCCTQRGSVGSLLALRVPHIPGFRCTPAGDWPAHYLVNVWELILARLTSLKRGLLFWWWFSKKIVEDGSCETLASTVIWLGRPVILKIFLVVFSPAENRCLLSRSAFEKLSHAIFFLEKKNEILCWNSEVQ